MQTISWLNVMCNTPFHETMYAIDQNPHNKDIIFMAEKNQLLQYTIFRILRFFNIHLIFSHQCNTDIMIYNNHRWRLGFMIAAIAFNYTSSSYNLLATGIYYYVCSLRSTFSANSRFNGYGLTSPCAGDFTPTGKSKYHLSHPQGSNSLNLIAFSLTSIEPVQNYYWVLCEFNSIANLHRAIILLLCQSLMRRQGMGNDLEAFI